MRELLVAAESVRALETDCATLIESVGSSAGAKRIVAGARDHFRRIDILVNNAGGFSGATILDMTQQQ